MGLFATLSRRHSAASVSQVPTLPEPVRMGLPARFEAVAEALAGDADASVACAVVGREMARDGADLGEALDGLRSTYLRVRGELPDYCTMHALCVAWSEETLAYAHQISCEDPLTGLASLAHVRARLSEVYRGAEQSGEPAATSHALVVVDLPLLPTRVAAQPFGHALRLVRAVEFVRAVFGGQDTIAQLGHSRLVVLTTRTENIGRMVASLRELLSTVPTGVEGSRVWIEGLPSSNAAAAALLDELTRG